MTIQLTKEEGQVLINLINIALQTKGIEAAEASIYFVKKIQDAAKLIDVKIDPILHE